MITKTLTIKIIIKKAITMIKGGIIIIPITMIMSTVVVTVITHISH